ncbi:MAG TPA: ATP-binding protein [Kofleriaceae bacterium]|nr:ATP-binding protein [Kofleriaceae bacterium]
MMAGPIATVDTVLSQRRIAAGLQRTRGGVDAVFAALPSTTLVVSTEGVVLQAYSGYDPVLDVSAAVGMKLHEVLGIDADGADAARWQMWLACAVGQDLELFRMYAADAPRSVPAAGARAPLGIDVGPLVENKVVVGVVLSVRKDDRVAADAPATTLSAQAPAVVADARGALEDCDAELATLTRDPQSRHALHRMFRSVHGLKGLAGSAGLRDVAARAHRIEDLLQSLRSTSEPPTTRSLESLREQLSELRVAVALASPDAGPDAMTVLYAACRPLLPRIERAAAAWAEQPRRARRARRLERLMTGFAEAVGRAHCDELAVCVEIVRTDVARAKASSRPSRRDLAEIEQGVDELATWLRLYHELHVEVRASDAAADVAGMLVSCVRPESGVVDVAGLIQVARTIGVLSITSHLESTRGAGRAIAAVRDLPAMLTPARANATAAQAARNLDSALAAVMRRLGETPGTERVKREVDKLAEAVAAVTWASLDDVAARVQAAAAVAAAETGKQVDVELDVVGIRLPGDLRQTVFEVLAHAVRNAIDHGIEPAADRLSAHKLATGRIAAMLDIEDGRLLVEVRDDGRGVDLERVKQRALSLGMDVGSTPEHLLELLFEPGFSTARAVTTVSGRGVGMDAIRAMARARGGSARLHSVDGKGTILMVDLGPTTPVVLDPRG